MKILRSWPERIPEGRNYVVDGLDRLVMSGYDYRVLADVDDDVLMLEWDMAVGGDDLEAFARRAKLAPDRVLVAPYRIYVSSGGLEVKLRQPIWCHRKFNSPYTVEFVQPSDPVCHFFGFGMIYLPRVLVEKFLPFLEQLGPGRNFDDSTFSQWHYRNAPDPEVPITWDIRPVHLHYKLDQRTL